MKGDELNEQEEVKRVLRTILELSLVMQHLGFGATLDPDPIFFSPDTKKYFY